MKKLLFILLVIFLISFGNQVVFAQTWGTKITEITGYYVYSDGNAHFRVAEIENPDGCTGGGYLTLDSTAKNFNKLYATLIAAHTSKQTVQLSYEGCTAVGSYPLVKAIAVPSVW